MKFYSKLSLLGFITVLLVSCGGLKVSVTPRPERTSLQTKVSDLNEKQLHSWSHLDLIRDTVPGMSVDMAYSDIIGKTKGQRVIVGVIDSGVDINHEDLDGVIWTNEDEIPGNGKDDDKNGYIDDVHGWNFLGDAVYENMELVRILKKGDDGSSIYQKAKAEREQKVQEAEGLKQRIDQMILMIPVAEEMVKTTLGKTTYTKKDLEAMASIDSDVNQSKEFLLFLMENDLSKEKLEDYIKQIDTQLTYHYNLDFDGRKVVGDDPDDLNDKFYGNANVIGPDLESAKHGTHVSGIIAAERNNGIGVNGVAQNVQIMVVRAVPDGDEYDKDVALAIRYAADNGAKVINTSFGKYYSPHSDWVREAIVYAASKDVLIVNAAGNEAYDLDLAENAVYPNDAVNNGSEISNNFITIGALAPNTNNQLVASYSNYGKDNVDLFAPGDEIFSTTPDNKYETLGGTSMAAPAVAGVAALIRSYFPELSAAEVKQILMESGIVITKQVAVGGDQENLKNFDQLSRSGRIANAYNALILASRKKSAK